MTVIKSVACDEVADASILILEDNGPVNVKAFTTLRRCEASVCFQFLAGCNDNDIVYIGTGWASLDKVARSLEEVVCVIISQIVFGIHT